MAHVLLVESWVGAMAHLLPRAVLEAGHRFSFLTRDLHHYLRGAPAGGAHPLLAAHNVLTAETNDLPGLLDHAQRLHQALRFDGVLTSCDYYLDTAAQLAAHLGLPGTHPAAVRRAYRKDLARAAMDAADVPQPRYALAQSWSDVSRAARELGFPLVVKPVDLCAGMYVREVADEAGLRAAFDALTGFPVNARHQPRVPTVLLEELLTGPEVSVETVTVDGHTTVVGVTDKSLGGASGFVETGHMFPALLDPATTRRAGEVAVAALAAVGLDRGVAHTELRLTPAGPRVVEVNPRPAGNQITELVRRVTGIDLPMVYAQLALGETADLTPADTGVRSAAIAFVLPPRPGVVARIDGTGAWQTDPRVVDWSVKPAGHRAGDGSSNNDYLGHVMVVDTAGAGARTIADGLAAQVRVGYVDDDGSTDRDRSVAAPAGAAV
ncbi:ATP-grasp domain-containing protein [Solwaraspora sp. WMMD792]|uniref:ATP-grasp domain-containing protein n=1 Tax=Solwaraspora sp. WMMD792 TaxID=3016099 RepID=UPI002416FA27|nr:ATP-grasp domain-containing protein [Solwaraspora sp. WMMD792]MDG4774293.1 ATP-grasp domain-containing protein [Solwaraspora sp. WMMD792]